MVRQVKAYGCEYKCGQKVVLSKSSMISHESRCFYNPKNKACASCKYFEREDDSNGMEGQYEHKWVNLLCHYGDGVELDRLTSNCEFHKSK